MKYTAVIATIVAAASAQQACDPSTIPSCARNLIDSNVKAVTGCDATDYKCICTPAAQAKLTSAITADVITACGADKVSDVLSGTQKFCTAILSGTCGSGSGSSSSSSAESKPASTTAAPSSSSSSTKPMMTSSTSTWAPKPSVSSGPTPSGNGTTKPTGGPVPAGAGMLTVAGSGLVGVLVAAIALL